MNRAMTAPNPVVLATPPRLAPPPVHRRTAVHRWAPARPPQPPAPGEEHPVTNGSATAGGGGASSGPGAEAGAYAERMPAALSADSMAAWCQSRGLPDEVLQRLLAERFQCPEHLVHLRKRDLDKIVGGMKLGVKGSFYHSVHLLKEHYGVGNGEQHPLAAAGAASAPRLGAGVAARPPGRLQPATSWSCAPSGMGTPRSCSPPGPATPRSGTPSRSPTPRYTSAERVLTPRSVQLNQGTPPRPRHPFFSFGKPHRGPGPPWDTPPWEERPSLQPSLRRSSSVRALRGRVNSTEHELLKRNFQTTVNTSTFRRLRLPEETQRGDFNEEVWGTTPDGGGLRQQDLHSPGMQHTGGAAPAPEEQAGEAPERLTLRCIKCGRQWPDGDVYTDDREPDVPPGPVRCSCT
mmetsp:Transcript_126775/g.358656  ORF Transcript_126775/g.358656 Transcript_126775/m.358656 type:complete len:405 (-) Transcript_126775:127-1341(-)